MDAEITLRNVLETIATELDYRPHDISITPITSGGANYTSAIFLATIAASNQPDVDVFAKVADVGEPIRVRHKMDRLFKTERFAYTDLLKTYKTMQEQYRIPKDQVLLFPKFYGCSAEYMKETVVLENLVAKGYSSFDRFKSVTWEYASTAVTALARLHALSFAYQHDNPEEFKEKLEGCKYEFPDPTPEEKALFGQMTRGATLVVREENKARLLKFIEDDITYEEYKKYVLPREGFTKVLAHGDYRPSNLMCKRQDDQLQILPVDYQTIHSVCPVNDLIYFTMVGSDREFRKLHYTQLIDHYHQQLGLELQRFKLDIEKIYPRATFDSELKETMPFGLLLAVVVLPMVTVEPDLAPKFNKDLKGLEIAPNDLYAQRLNEIVDDYVEWGLL